MKYAPVDLLICHVLADVQVPPLWLARNSQCWEMIVDRWFAEGWVEMQEACLQQRLMMPGASHHQSNRHLREYVAIWVRESISLF